LPPSSSAAVLDANVLFPASLRDLLLRVVEADLYTPYWSDTILDEALKVVNVDDDDVLDGVERSERWKGRGLRYFLISCADWLDDVLNHRFHRLCKIIAASSWWSARAS